MHTYNELLFTLRKITIIKFTFYYLEFESIYTKLLLLIFHYYYNISYKSTITKNVFLYQKAFHGPLHTFGKLMYQQMKNGRVNNDRITREQFVAAGTEIVSKMNIADQRQYYFRLYASGKDYLTKEGRHHCL